MKNILTMIFTKYGNKNSTYDKEPYFGNYRLAYIDSRAIGNICGKALTDNDSYQFFPEDGSDICSDCRRKHS